MSEINLIKSCLRKYLSSSMRGNYVSNKGATLILSGSASPIMNFAIIDNAIEVAGNVKFLLDHFNVNGFVISDINDHGIISNLPLDLSYIGQLVVAKSDGYEGESEPIEGMRIEQLNDKNKDDYIKFMFQHRGVEPEIMNSIISENENDVIVYLVYSNEEAIAAGTAIKNGSTVFIFDAVVRNDKMGNGIFSSLVTRSVSDVSKTENYEYYALISSEPSLRGATKANFKKIKFVDLWIKKMGVN